jgi:hypothetical protein
MIPSWINSPPAEIWPKDNNKNEDICDISQTWLSCLRPLVFLLAKTFKLFDFLIFWSWIKFDIYVFISAHDGNFLLVLTMVTFYLRFY